MRVRLVLSVLAGTLLVASPWAVAAAHEHGDHAAKQDLADAAQGTFEGDVISDARGSSQSGVSITVTKTGPNTVEVTSDYDRLPTFTVKLTRAMHTIQQKSGDAVFLLDQSKSPETLMVTVDDASWAGERR